MTTGPAVKVRPSPNAYGCQECGMVVKEPREYHPYWFCVLHKAGQDPRAILEAERRRIGGGAR